MSKIEKIEELLSDWKAKAYKSVAHKLLTQAKMEANVMMGISLALAILKRPSNKKVEDLCAECRYNGKCETEKHDGGCSPGCYAFRLPLNTSHSHMCGCL